MQKSDQVGRLDEPARVGRGEVQRIDDPFKLAVPPSACPRGLILLQVLAILPLLTAFIGDDQRILIALGRCWPHWRDCCPHGFAPIGS